jgi:rhamnosyltransferase
MTEPRIGVAVITHHAREQLGRCLPPLLGSPLQPRVLVVNSSSGDGTVEEAERLGAATLVIDRSLFNHGSTRELARRTLGTEIVVMATPDAYAIDEHALDLLVAPVREGRSSIAYGRQVPRAGTHVFESYLRGFNYPPESSLRDIADAESLGAGAFFCSNAFAAYSSAALDEVGGFPPALAHEDAIVTAMLLRRGHRVAYVAEAVVEHSHSYSLRGDFRRYFDAGLARQEYSELFAVGARHKGAGRRFAAGLFAEVARSRPHLLPYAVAAIAAKGLGFAAGSRGAKAPLRLKRRLSNQDYYWSPSPLAAGPRTAERSSV